MADDSAAERLAVGLVRGLHGLRGAVRVEILTDDPDRLAAGSRVFPEDSDTPLTIAWSHADGPGLLLRFAEVATRDRAEALRDRYLEAFVRPDALPEGSYYWHELDGAAVATVDGRALGSVVEVFRAGGGEVLVVQDEAGAEVLIPAVTSVVREFSPREGRIVVDAEALGLDADEPRSRVRGRRTTRARRERETQAHPAATEPDETAADPEAPS